jgi:hypothetical protein
LEAISESMYQPISQEDINKYKEEYDEWLGKVKDELRRFPVKLNHRAREHKISVTIINNGYVPAEDVIVEFCVKGGLLIEHAIERNDLTLDLPPPPKPPKRRYRGAAGFAFDFNPPSTRIPPFLTPSTFDPHEFYCRSGSLVLFKETLVFDCEEFRHQTHKQELGLTILVPIDKKITNDGLLITITAKNLKEPFNATIPIRINYKDNVPSYKKIEKIVDDWLEGESPKIESKFDWLTKSYNPED